MSRSIIEYEAQYHVNMDYRITMGKEPELHYVRKQYFNSDNAEIYTTILVCIHDNDRCSALRFLSKVNNGYPAIIFYEMKMMS